MEDNNPTATKELMMILNLCVSTEEHFVVTETAQDLNANGNANWFRENRATFKQVDLQAGLDCLKKEVDGFEGTLTQEWEEVKADFLAKIEGKKGTFTLWSVEDSMDQNVLFEEEGEQI